MPPAAVHGRRIELDLVAGAVTSVVADQRAALVLVTAEAGFGKTALVAAAAHAAAGQGFTMLHTGLTEPETQLSWAGLHQLLRPVDDDRLAELPDGQRSAISAALGRLPDAVDAGLVAFGVAALLERITSSSPVVLMIDDLHWLDQPTAAAIAFAIRATADRPVLTLVTARPGHELPIEADRLVAADRRHSIALAGVSAAALHHIVEDECGVALRRPDLIRLHTTSEGSPLHAVQVARLIASGVEPVEAIAHPTVPAAISSRLDALPADVGHLLGAAALLATPGLDVLQRLRPDLDVERLLAVAEAADLVRVEHSVVGFRHPLIRSAALERLGGMTRLQLARRAAELVGDVEERAELLASGITQPDEVVARALEDAADLAGERGAAHVAADRYERAAELTPLTDPAARSRRLLRAAESSYVAGDRVRPVELADRITELAADRADRFQATVVRILAFGNRPDRRTAAALAEAALADFDEPHEQARLHGLMGQAYMTWDLRSGLAAATAAVEAAERSADPDRLAIERDRLLRARFVVGEPLDLDGVTRDALDERRTVWDRLDLAFVLGHADRPEPAFAVYEQALTEARQSGSIDELQLVHDEYAEALLRAGRPVEAEQHWAIWNDLQRMVGGTALGPRRLNRAVIDALLGRTEVARAVVTEVFTEGELEPADELAARSNAMVVVLTAADWEELAAHGRRLRELAAEIGYDDLAIAPFRAELVEALVHLGALDEADDVATEHERLADRNQTRRGFVESLRSRALVTAGRGDLTTAIETMEQAIELHDGWPVPFEHGRNLLTLGTMQRRAGRRQQAAATLDVARTIFGQIGAAPWVARVDAEAARLGARRRAAPDEMTPTERQIALLVARGRTNAEVAAELAVSLRTVESNLTRVYRKLGVRSRTELAAALARADDAS